MDATVEEVAVTIALMDLGGEDVTVVVTYPMNALRVAEEAALDATVRCNEEVVGIRVVVVVLLLEAWTIGVLRVAAAAATGVRATMRRKSTCTRLLAAVVVVLLPST